MRARIHSIPRTGLRNTVVVNRQQRTERGFDRLVNFSDAIVAIAITLLVLPLMDLETVDPDEGTWALLTNDATSPVFLSFALTFLVTTIMWLAHHRLFEYVSDYDDALIWLNMFWLMLIVLLPFMSAELNKDGPTTGTAPIYCLIMAGLSAVLGLISRHVRKHPALLAEGAKPEDLGGIRSWAFAAYLAALAILALWFPDTAVYLLFGLFFVGRFADVAEARARARTD